MREIGLFEIQTHEHILYYLCRMSDVRKNEVTLFTTRDIFESLKDLHGLETDEFRWVFRGNDSLGGFLGRVEDRSEALDVLFINTLGGSLLQFLRYWLFDPACPSLAWVYDLNLELGGLNLGNPPLANLRSVVRRRVFTSFDAINLEYPPIREYLDSTIRYDGPVYEIVPTLYEGGAAEATDDRVEFVVPGRIEPSRRDYDLVLDAFAPLIEEYGDRLHLRLLGRPYGDGGSRIVGRCEEIEDSGGNVEYYTEWIPFPEFHERIREADFLLCPLRERTRVGGVEERYGTTKGSGNVFDGLRDATPLVLPAHFRLAEFIESSTVVYDGVADLRGQVRRLLRQPDEVERLRQAAVGNSREFTLRRQRERFDAAVTDLLERSGSGS